MARHEVLEQSLAWSSQAANPWEDVNVAVTLTSPTHKQYRIGGFYAGPGMWKFRFAPPQAGRWSWTAKITEGSRNGSARGSFDVVKGSSPGFVRQSPWNPYRWTFANGTPFYPIGMNNCTLPVEDPLQRWGLDGGFRNGNHALSRWVDMNTYMRAYSTAGFDLFRWGPDNCSFPLYDKIDPAGNVYSVRYGDDADQLFQTLRRYGFRIEMVLFGFKPPFAQNPSPDQLAAVERYARYVADRYGAYVDYWELMNEARASDDWLTQVATALERADPYHHPVGTSWSKPELPALQFGSDHWYQVEDVHDSDSVGWAHLRGEPARRFRKPTLVDEQGNRGVNWDPASAVRMRLRSWTAFFAEATLVFWNASNAKDDVGSLIYLGPQERGYVHVLQNYTRGFDPRAVVVAVPASPSNVVRGYALRGPREYGLYLVATGDRSSPTRGVRIQVDTARAGSAIWLDPASGRVLARAKVVAGKHTLTVPPFTVDVALKIAP